MKYRWRDVAAASLILFWMVGCNHSESKEAPENRKEQVAAIKVSIATVKPAPIRDILVLPGETEAWQDVLVAADTAGRVERIEPQEGNSVKKGDLLVKIDVSGLKAAMDRAEAAYQLADELYQRRQRLFERKIIGQEERDRSQTERRLAEGNLRQARVEYERGFIKAPISGIINHLYVDEGEYIDRGKPLLELVDVDKIKITVNVPELDVRYLRVGHTPAVRIDAFADRRLAGIVDFIAYKADPATKTFPVKVLIDNRSHEIRPGMIARVFFLRRVVADALVAPLFALVDKGGERLVFIEKDGVAHARTVAIGVIEGDRIQITEGLKAGDHLIVAGQKEVEEGMRVLVQ